MRERDIQIALCSKRLVRSTVLFKLASYPWYLPRAKQPRGKSHHKVGGEHAYRGGSTVPGLFKSTALGHSFKVTNPDTALHLSVQQKGSHWMAILAPLPLILYVICCAMGWVRR